MARKPAAYAPDYTFRMANTIETQERPRRGPEPPDLSEKGGMKNGQPQRSDERLFMQLLAFGGCRDANALGAPLGAAGVEGAVYEDANDPQGVAILTVTKDPNFFVSTLRPLLNTRPFDTLVPKP